jgi:pimeloyl-ACP methyl ester carboxylesterase
MENMKQHHRVAMLILSAIAASLGGRLAAELPFDAQFHKPLELQIKPLQRLGLYRPSGPHFVSVTGRVNPDGNVYFVTHGWAPGYFGKVNKIIANGHIPLAWDSSIGFNDGWFEKICESIRKADPGATIFFYSWIEGSATPTTLDPWESLSHTDGAGIELSKAIQQVLPPQFDAHRIHILGHSHGARVATVAAVRADTHPAHLTLFDSPERFLEEAANKLYYYLEKLSPSRSSEGTFVDNYYSMFGVCYNNQVVPKLKNIVDFRLRALPCNGHIVCRHSYPITFYELASEASSSNLGVHWSPLLNGVYGTVKPDYVQTWLSNNPLATESRDSCFGPPDWIEAADLSFVPRLILRILPLPVQFVSKEGGAIFLGNTQASLAEPSKVYIRLASTKGEGESLDKEATAVIQGNNRISLAEPGRSLLQLTFTKEEGDDAILFDFNFLRPGDGDEFVAWIDDFKLLSLTAPQEGAEKGRVAIGIDDFENGHHTLILALYGIGERNTALSISNLDKATMKPEEKSSGEPGTGLK